MRGKISSRKGRIIAGMIILLHVHILNGATSKRQIEHPTSVPIPSQRNTTEIYPSSHDNMTNTVYHQNKTEDDWFSLRLSLAYIGGVISGCILGIMIFYFLKCKQHKYLPQCWSRADNAEEHKAKTPTLLKSSIHKKSVRNEYLVQQADEGALYTDVIDNDPEGETKDDGAEAENDNPEPKAKTKDVLTSDDKTFLREGSKTYNNQRFFGKQVPLTESKTSSKPKMKHQKEDETTGQEKQTRKQEKNIETEPTNVIHASDTDHGLLYVNVDNEGKALTLKPNLPRKPSFLHKLNLKKAKTLDPHDKAYEQLRKQSSHSIETTDLYEPLQVQASGGKK